MQCLNFWFFSFAVLYFVFNIRVADLDRWSVIYWLPIAAVGHWECKDSCAQAAPPVSPGTKHQGNFEH